MNKVITVLIIMLMSLCSFAGVLTEADKKLVWQQAYGLEKEDWTIVGLGSIEKSLMEITEKQKDGKMIVTGASYGNDGQDAAINAAMENAALEVALSKGFSMRVISVTQPDSDSPNADTQQSKEMSALNLNVEASLPLPTLIIIRERGEKYDCMCFYVFPL
ncbi:MAG: hypothetical protein HDR90_08515 [Bacteroides sp.]|nr:hypothetical protein [Bacteroides sp.]MDE5828468.1 hypothetical protein [Duncaniella sp.]